MPGGGLDQRADNIDATRSKGVIIIGMFISTLPVALVPGGVSTPKRMYSIFGPEPLCWANKITAGPGLMSSRKPGGYPMEGREQVLGPESEGGRGPPTVNAPPISSTRPFCPE